MLGEGHTTCRTRLHRGGERSTNVSKACQEPSVPSFPFLLMRKCCQTAHASLFSSSSSTSSLSSSSFVVSKGALVGFVLLRLADNTLDRTRHSDPRCRAMLTAKCHTRNQSIIIIKMFHLHYYKGISVKFNKALFRWTQRRSAVISV